jgi:hypothetical protein
MFVPRWALQNFPTVLQVLLSGQLRYLQATLHLCLVIDLAAHAPYCGSVIVCLANALRTPFPENFPTPEELPPPPPPSVALAPFAQTISKKKDQS